MSLAVICSHFNPAGFHTPRRNLLRFMRQLTTQKIPVFVAELAYDDEPFFLAEQPNIYQFRSDRSNIFWQKENLLNLAVERLPDRYDKIAWIDPDLLFNSSNWAEQAVQALDHWATVQLFSDAFLTNRDGSCYQHMKSAMADGDLKMGANHPGFAWAARRDLWKIAGGLCEFAILGGGDALFAGACLNNKVPSWLYYPQWDTWMSHSEKWVRENGGCGFIQGAVFHEWHGDDSNRDYVNRHSLLKDVDIERSLGRRNDGLLQFTPSVSVDLRAALSKYFLNRKEDGSA